MDAKNMQRVIDAANLILSGKTIREVAADFGVSKSTIHRDIQEFLPDIDGELYEFVQQELKKHFQEKYKNGGEATKKKYAKAGKRIGLPIKFEGGDWNEY